MFNMHRGKQHSGINQHREDLETPLSVYVTLKADLFTVAAYDNVDHNPRSKTLEDGN